jgi:hypothetical protein
MGLRLKVTTVKKNFPPHADARRYFAMPLLLPQHRKPGAILVYGIHVVGTMELLQLPTHAPIVMGHV